MGLIIANARVVGASNRKMVIAPFHFGPRKTEIMSSAKRAHAAVIGEMAEGVARIDVVP